MLREDFKDDIFAGARKYQIVKNSDGTVSFIDVTEYTQEGDAIGAAEFNQIGQEVNGKVEKVDGKGLSTNDYTTAEKNKLKGIAAGAEANVQSDWSTTDTSSDAYIKNKPISMKNPAALTFTGGADGSYDGSSAKTVTIPAAVRVKGGAETTYHTGDVNLTPANIGAVALGGGTMTGTLTVTTQNVMSSSIGGSAVNLCSNTLKVSPGAVTVSGGISTQVLSVPTINGLQYRPVVIGPSAPGDKTALWIDTST